MQRTLKTNLSLSEITSYDSLVIPGRDTLNSTVTRYIIPRYGQELYFRIKLFDTQSSRPMPLHQSEAEVEPCFNILPVLHRIKIN
jgi:hypothetical protein